MIFQAHYDPCGVSWREQQNHTYGEKIPVPCDHNFIATLHKVAMSPAADSYDETLSTLR